MVDLVKIRKKAKERQQRAKEEAATAASDTPSEEMPTPGRKKAAGSKPSAKGGSRTAGSRKKPPKKSVPGSESSRKATASRTMKQVAIPDEADGHQNPPGGSARGETPAAAGAREDDKRQRNDRLEEFKRKAGRIDSAMGQRVQESDGGEQFLEFLTFRVAGEQYGIEIERIVEIITPRPATKVPNAKNTIVGVIALRGTIVTLMDLRRILGHPADGKLTDDSRIIVIQNDAEYAGFVVDRVSRVVKIDPEAIEEPPLVSATEQSEYVRGVFRHEGALQIQLDLERLLS